MGPLDYVKRVLTLQTHRVSALPVLLISPHGGCNCKCVMCDIWKGNRGAPRLEPSAIAELIPRLRKWGTRRVALTGGEALMHPDFFEICRLLGEANVQVTLLSSGLLLEAHAGELVRRTHEVIVSLDGPPQTHDAIRRVAGGFRKLERGVCALKRLDSAFPVSGRCVIQRANYAEWPAIVNTAREIGLDRISFLAADVSSEAFNRPRPWDADRQGEVRLDGAQLSEMKSVLEEMIEGFQEEIASGFIAESEQKLWRIYHHYAALCGMREVSAPRCNAPWVSAVIEADGAVKPCFFHEPYGNLKERSLSDLLNGPKAVAFRRELDVAANPVCKSCVCALNLPPGAKP